MKASLKVILIGFEREDEVFLEDGAKDAAAHPPPPLHIAFPFESRIGLTQKIFEQLGLTVESKPLGRLGISRTLRMVWLDKVLRPMEWRYRKTREAKEAHEELSPIEATNKAPIVALLRSSDAYEIFPRNKNGFAIFCRKLKKIVTDVNQGPVCFMLGVLPGPALPANFRFENIPKFTKRKCILFSSANALRDAGHRIREDGSTSAAVEDICGVLLRSDKSGESIFFGRFSEIYIRIR